MKITYAEYIKKTSVSVLVAETIFNELLISSSIKTIKDVVTTTSGGTPLRSNSEYYNGEIPWLKSGELNDGLIEKASEFITEKGLKNSSAKLHPKGTLLVAMYGATAGKTGIINFEASTNQAVCAIFPKNGILQDYLYWFFRSHRFQFIEKSKGGAQPNISQTVIKKTILPVPEIKIQKQVIDILNEIEEKNTIEISKISNTFKNAVVRILNFKNNLSDISTELILQLDLVKKLRQAFLREAMQGKLTAEWREQNPNVEPATELLTKIKAEKEQLIKEKKIKNKKPLPPIAKEEIPFEIPESWVWCRLGDLASIVRGGSPRPAGDKRYYDGNIPFLKVGDLTGYEGKYCDKHSFTIKEAGLYKTRFVEANTLMLTNSGATLGVPRICTFSTTFNDGIAAFLGIELMNKEFLFYFLRNKSDYFLQEASRGQGQPNLNTDIISITLLALPPLSEQKAIVEKLDKLMAYCDSLKESIKNSQSQNEMLLQQVLREALEPKTEKDIAV